MEGNFEFHFGIKKWENAAVEKRCVSSTHFVLVGKSTDSAVHTITCCSQFSLSIFCGANSTNGKA